MSKRFAVVLALVAIGGVAAGVGGYWYVNQPHADRQKAAAPPKGPAAVIGEQRPDFTLTDLNGKSRQAGEWDGKVMMINFWATWCPPCRREIPAFVKLYENYKDQGLVIVGIALDSRQNAIDFTGPMLVDYPILVAEQEGIGLTREYGNDLGVLPYTVFVDRHGKIVKTARHELTYEQAETAIKPLF
jgi:thiol-disulfide isomerase/thioredoxin